MRQAQRHLLDALTRNSRLLQQAQRNAALGYWEYTGHFHWSPPALQLLGRDPGSAHGSLEQLLSWLHPAERPAVQRGMRALFVFEGGINVDTGATNVALSQSEANRIGLDWKRGRPGLSQTANGTVPVYAVNLTSVRVGDVEIANVAGVVIPSDMPMVLLGNSFLNRFQMQKNNDQLTLEKR